VEIDSTSILSSWELKVKFWSRAWQITPVIPATKEVKIKKIAVQGQPEHKVTETASQSIRLTMVVYACHSSYWGSMNRRITFSGWPGQKHKILLEK
jgi:hypothetical protein